jgi:hypothetical protein
MMYLILQLLVVSFELPNIFILFHCKVPMGGEERMAEFPPLVAEDITLKEGLGGSEAVADIKFSSAGNFIFSFEDRVLLHSPGHLLPQPP